MRGQVFIFDCDGVLWRGEVRVEGVVETLDFLRAAGKTLVRERAARAIPETLRPGNV